MGYGGHGRDRARLDAVVLGGGPAGLAAAWYAARAGRRVALVEQSEQVGGLASSFDVAGVRVDHGSHRLHPSTDADVLEDVRSVLGDELQQRARDGRIRLYDRWVAFPLRAADLVTAVPPAFAARAARDIAAAPVRVRRGPDTFASRVRAALGTTVATSFYEPYARKLFGVPADELSPELFRRRVGARSGGGIVRRVLSRNPPPGFWYPAGGFGRIPEAIGSAAVEAGAEVLTGAAATSVRPDADGAVVGLADGRELCATTVLSTLPAAVTTSLYDGDTVDPGTLKAADQLTYRSALLAYLVVPRRPYTTFDAHYFPEAGVPLTRLSEPSNYRTSPADPTGHTVLCAEMPGSSDDPWWALDPEAIGRLVSGVLQAQGLPDPAPTEVVVRRVAHVYPVYRLGHEEHQRTLEAWADGRPELVLFGRQPLFAHDNTHHALAMGRAAAACLGAGGNFDRDHWRSLRDSFRDHVVED
jgi:protoporphyrinogen oxidase